VTCLIRGTHSSAQLSQLARVRAVASHYHSPTTTLAAAVTQPLSCVAATRAQVYDAFEPNPCKWQEYFASHCGCAL
jgi:hypothetical protein